MGGVPIRRLVFMLSGKVSSVKRRRSTKDVFGKSSLFTLGRVLECFRHLLNGYFYHTYRVKVGLALLEEFNDRARLPVLETLYHEFISFWKEPIQMTSESLIRTHKESLLEGQMEFSMSSAFHSCRHSFMCGTNLTKLKNDCQKVTDKMVSGGCRQ